MVPRSMDSIYTCLLDDDDSCSSDDDDDDDSCSYSRNHTPTGSTPSTTDMPPTMYVPPAVIELEKKREQCPVFLDHLKNLDITWFSTLEDVKKKITLSEDQCCYLETEDKEHIIKDDICILKYEELKDQLLYNNPGFDDFDLKRTFHESCYLPSDAMMEMKADLGSIISKDMKDKILNYLKLRAAEYGI